MKLNAKNRALASAAAAIFMAANVNAQEGEKTTPLPTTSTSTISIPSEQKSTLREHLFADFVTYYHASTLNDLGSRYSVNSTGHQDTTAISGLDSELNMAYLINPET